MMNQTHPLIMFTLLLLPAVCGCSGSEVADADDDHHLEHFVPHHKPANFAAAVEEIEHRAEHLSDHAGHGHADEAEEFQELVDIINWIPELAADSDLDETDWNKANSAATALAANLADQKPDGAPDLKELPDVIAAELQTLESLTAAAGKPEPAIHHDDHHHDHDHEH